MFLNFRVIYSKTHVLKLNNIHLKNCLLILIIFLISGCSTEKNTIVTRSYHNLTANYNIFFNGDESFKKGLLKQENAFADNYATILPLFKYSNEEIASTITPDMERAIKKAMKLISMHSITAKPKRKKGKISKRQKEFYNKNEYNRWVDDSYMLIGKANFYKRDFSTAENTFNFIIQDYKNNPVIYKAYLWLLRIYIEQNDFKKAGETFDKLNSEKNFPKKLKGEYNAIYADYYIKQELYKEAVPKLIKAIEKTRKRKTRIRYTYILAQLYKETGDNKNASIQFQKVIKMNPPYEMAFNAKLNSAGLLSAGSDKSKEIKKELLKMLKDEKNKEYLDQIYYVLGKMELNANNTELAIDYFKRSASSSVYNTTQKVMTYLQLADIYFNIPKYQFAKEYYDSAVIAITPDYPNYDKIIVNTKNLNELVTNLNIIEYEDSVQKVAAMSEEEREELINKLIEEAKEEEKILEELKNQGINEGYYNVNTYNTYRDNLGSGSKWYFYNPSSISFGQNEFERIWGKRKLEDNWRRKNKQSMSIDDELADEETENQDSTDLEQSNKNKFKKTEKNYYLEDLPLTPEKLEKSNERIADALFKAAGVYRNKIEDNEQAETTYEKFTQRFPENENAIYAYYNLYVINVEQNDIVKTDFYKNLILRKYPNSVYVNILTNPNYLTELEEERLKLETFYEETYNDYLKGNYNNVKTNYNYALTNYNESYLMPKFAFLNALSIGQTDGRRALKSSLEKVIKTYPDSEVKQPANDIIVKIEEKSFEPTAISGEPEVEPSGIPDTIKEPVAELYKYNPDTTHFIMIIARKTMDMNQLKFNITSFIVDFYDYDDYKVSDEPLNNTFQLILIKEFENKEKSIEFYRKLMADTTIFKDINESDFQYFAISSENYSAFIKDKSVIDYKKFFEKNYLLKNEEN